MTTRLEPQFCIDYALNKMCIQVKYAKFFTILVFSIVFNLLLIWLEIKYKWISTASISAER